MGLPPNAAQYFAQERIEAAEKHRVAVEAGLSTEGQEDRRAFEKFYNNLALFSGGTIALSITYLGYLRTLDRPLNHLGILKAGWFSLFACLLASLTYVICNLYYSHYFRQREHADAWKRELETDANEIENLNVANIRTAAELAAYRNPRIEQALEYAERSKSAERSQNRYYFFWLWAGRIARLGFALGIGMLLWFAISNT
jgi:hypothetical protein